MDATVHSGQKTVARLILAVMAIGLSLIFLHQHRSHPASKPVAWSGVTSQGEVISATTVRGLLTNVDTHVTENCTDGSVFKLHWNASSDRFVQHGLDLTGAQTGYGSPNTGEPDSYDTRIWAHMGATPSGTITAQDILTRGGGTVLCRSDAVTFQLKRSA
ncbi:MAG: hypothetical protein ACXVRH_15910 [Thermoleophilaceae bacterium]